jgi:maleate isomerase
LLPDQQHPRRIGMITPSSNTVVEPVTTAMTAALYPLVTAHYTRIRVTSISLERESLSHFDLDPMLRAATLLADAGMDAIVWNGTSGAWRGFEADERLCEAIARECGVPATTSTLAQLRAFELYDLKRYALAVPYLDSVREAIVSTYAGRGFECVGSAALGISTNADFAYVPAERIRELVRASDSPAAEAIAIICTNLPAAWSRSWRRPTASPCSTPRSSRSGRRCAWSA